MQFTKRTDCVKTQYGGYTAVDNMKIDGELTLGENVADNGGLRIAHMALMEALAGKTPAPIDGFTAEQRFFLGWGQIWCENVRPEQARLEVTTDVHSPGRVARQRRRRQHAGVREGVRLQGGAADGQREAVQGVVRCGEVSER